MAIDPTQSITLRNAWGKEYKSRWKRVIEEVKRDVNAPLSELIDRFVIAGGAWMLPFIRQTVAKSERLASSDAGEEVRFTAVERQELVDQLHSEAIQDIENIKAEVTGQGASASAQAGINPEFERVDISDLVGIVGATGSLLKDTTQNRITAITDRVNKIGITRSVASVAVRVVGGISMGIAKVAEKLGHAVVGVIPEMQFTTAGDERVCGRCQGLASEDRFGLGEGVFPIQETIGVIPVHPRCRCRWQLTRQDARVDNQQQEPDYEELERLFIANGWQKEQAPTLIRLPSFTINRGEQGAAGQDGRPGRDGKDGVVEIVTFDGERGPRGKIGNQGPRGFVGNQGEKGKRGERGERGAKGDKGAPGDDGIDGKDGRGIKSISYNRITNELVIKYTDGTEDKFKLPLLKRPLFGGGGSGQGRKLTTETSTTTATMNPRIEVHFCDGTSPYTLTIPDPQDGKRIRVINKNTATVTIVSASGNILGDATQELFTNETAILIGDGTDWW